MTKANNKKKEAKIPKATPAKVSRLRKAEAGDVMQNLPLKKLYANDEQARKHFDENELRSLAASIKVQGLISPIVVRPDGAGKYMIVAGERRYRACTLLELETVPVIIKQLSDASLTYQMIIENLQRVDISALEEARAYRKAMDDFDLTAEQLAEKLGILQPFRVHDRLTLLNLKAEYQECLRQGILTPTQAFYLSKVAPEFQDPFWRMIRGGKVDSNELAAVAQSFTEAANQPEMFPEVKLSEEEVRAIKSLEQHIDTMAVTLNLGTGGAAMDVEAMRTAYAKAERRLDDFNAFHKARQLYERILTQKELVTALGQGGVRKEKLDQQIKKFCEEVLQPLSNAYGCERVWLDNDLEIWRGNRRYSLLSRSARYAVRIIIQASIAMADRSELLVIDDVDEINDRRNRAGLMSMVASTGIPALVCMAKRPEENAPDLAARGTGQSAPKIPTLALASNVTAKISVNAI